ncbi:unnamed protein product [Trichobilharzia regenti]|nr:unnamed protein product [Trichobilharzia regenti]
MHTSLSEVQAVVGAHTTSLGGNALLSYHLSEVVILRPTSRNQAQCLINVCGDMAKVNCMKTATAAAATRTTPMTTMTSKSIKSMTKSKLN